MDAEVDTLGVGVFVKIKQGSLVVCLFLFLFVVIGGGLHLSPGGALLAASTGTPLLIHAFNRRLTGVEHDPPRSSRPAGQVRASAAPDSNETAEFETRTVVSR